MFDRIEISDEKLKEMEKRIYQDIKNHVNHEYYQEQVGRKVIEQIKTGWFPDFFEFLVKKINALQLGKGNGQQSGS